MAEELIPRAAGDDVIVPVRMRRSTFVRLTATANGRSVDISRSALMGLVPSGPANLPLSPGTKVWTLVVWSHEPVIEGVPANQAAVDALRQRTASARGAERSGEEGAMGGAGGDG